MGNEENQKNVKGPTPKIFQILDFGDFGDLGGDDEYEVEIYEDEDGSFYYIDPDTGEEVPCDEDGNAL